MDSNFLLKRLKLRHNGFATNYFSVHRGMRYGDPLCPLLSILSLEVLVSYDIEYGRLKMLDSESMILA